ncbi:MAG TPA: NAD(P)/FAD-dependent oxidoreductase [Candidatus Faecalibacterium gallistercoris]|uniref:NAD(P)/FAD-dependent oxidoreductase n=1 Tax=Candidatus Faecalibacterium gallistercoris TaxID=2838579 RepID=A0A9D2JMW0_9FIRM|nr:NAD(P)/FAD-dependent oxidoreductase [Candidatus Faecalibacterium gallistercoris]
MAKVVIIGSGPAGVSAALYTARAGIDTTVLTRGPGALARAEGIENYYGVPGPVSGAELERRGIEGAKAVGVQFVEAEAVGLTFTDKLTVETLSGDYPADAVILATGASRAAPPIPGLKALEGHGVGYCATCDAFFYRGKDVAVLGSGEYALHEASALLPLAKSVTLLTGGAPLTAEFPPEIALCTEKVEAILGEEAGKVTGVRLAGGRELPLDGVFVALGVAGSTALARKMGAEVDGNRIVVDEHMMTTVPGLFAAGDCTGGLLQVAKAVYEGAMAGSEAAKALRKGGFYGA